MLEITMLDQKPEGLAFSLRQIAVLEERLAQLEWSWDDLLDFYRELADSIRSA